MKKILAIVLSLALIVAVFAGCKGKNGGDNGDKAENTKPLVVGYSNFSSKFSPFFAESAYDQDVSKMTAVDLLNIDRQGAVVEKGKTGETRPYNGKDYKYEGPADLTVTENEDGTVDYDFELRDDIKFSDGEPLTVDDVIFSMYVFADPTYDGSSTFFAQPIKGMEEYRSGMKPLYQLLTKAGQDNKDFKLWTKEEQEAFWTELDATGPKFAQTIVDYCINNGYNEAGASVKDCAANWGYELKDGATVEDFWEAIKKKYDGDMVKAAETEIADSSIYSLMENYATYSKGVETGKSAATIEGIKKTGENSLKVTLSKIDASV